jgi:hypothetical protein
MLYLMIMMRLLLLKTNAHLLQSERPIDHYVANNLILDHQCRLVLTFEHFPYCISNLQFPHEYVQYACGFIDNTLKTWNPKDADDIKCVLGDLREFFVLI